MSIARHCLALPFVLLGAGAAAQEAASGQDVPVIGTLIDHEGAVSTDQSGIACQPPVGDTRVCLVVDDQGPMAQAVLFKDGTLIAKSRITLIEKESRDAILGSPPATHFCREKGKFGELDGEAVAYAEPYFYVVGSHGCSRNSNKFKESSFIVARLRLGADGALLNLDGSAPESPPGLAAIETTYRMADALQGVEPVRDKFARSLNTQDGLNIEGAFVHGNMLYAGLRAPLIGQDAILIGVDLGSLFAPGHERLASTPSVVSVADLNGAGVRDLAPLADGTAVLILAGPKVGDRGAAGVFSVPLPLPTAVKATPVLTLPETLKAEALLPLERDGDKLELIVLFDGPNNGKPTRYHAQLPAP